MTTVPSKIQPVSQESTITHSTVEPIIDWIDRELKEAYTGLWKSTNHGNILLEVRQAFQQKSATAIVTRFYRLLPRLEKNYFLLGYRIRQWLSVHFELRLSDPLERTSPRQYPLGPAVRSLVETKRHFFEHAECPLPLNDIRTTVCRRFQD